MRNSSQTETRRTPWGQVAAKVVYIAAAIASCAVVAYGVFVLVVGIIAAPGFYGIALMSGLPLIITGGTYLAFMIYLLRASSPTTKYRLLTWITVLLGLVALLFAGYFVFVSLRGI